MSLSATQTCPTNSSSGGRRGRSSSTTAAGDASSPPGLTVYQFHILGDFTHTPPPFDKLREDILFTVPFQHGFFSEMKIIGWPPISVIGTDEDAQYATTLLKERKRKGLWKAKKRRDDDLEDDSSPPPPQRRRRMEDAGCTQTYLEELSLTCPAKLMNEMLDNCYGPFRRFRPHFNASDIMTWGEFTRVPLTYPREIALRQALVDSHRLSESDTAAIALMWHMDRMVQWVAEAASPLYSTSERENRHSAINHQGKQWLKELSNTYIDCVCMGDEEADEDLMDEEDEDEDDEDEEDLSE